MGNAVPSGAAHQFVFEDVYAKGDPYSHYAWFREHDPVHVGGLDGLLDLPLIHLFRHEDVRTCLRDPRLIRRPSSLPEMQALAEQQQVQPLEPGTMRHLVGNNMLYQDPPDHTRLRGLANRAFTPRVVADRREEIETITRDLLTAFREEQGGEGDLIKALAYPLPVLVIARVFGAPAEDVHRFRDWSAVIAAAIDAPMETLADLTDRANAVSAEINEYLGDLVTKRRADPQDDLMTRLIAARDDDDEDRLSDEELISMAVLLLVAGHETTVNLIGNGTLALLRNRDQWERLVADPSLSGNATEELLRYDTPVQMAVRWAGEDVEIGGVQVPRGSQVMLTLGSANRDEVLWEDADALRIDREVGRHLSFGMGIHFCLGSPLARLEGEVAFSTLAREAPELELFDPDPMWRPGAIFRGLERLDVRMN